MPSSGIRCRWARTADTPAAAPADRSATARARSAWRATYLRRHHLPWLPPSICLPTSRRVRMADVTRDPRTAESTRRHPAAATHAARGLRRAAPVHHRRSPGTGEERRAQCADRRDSTSSPTCSRSRLLSASCIEHPHQILESLTFQLEHLPAERRKLVIATTGIVELRRWALARLDDQALLDQPFQRAVQRCWPQPHLSAAAFQHVLHDAVAMLLATDQADENVEPVALERQERLGLRYWHANCISSDIYMRQALGGSHRSARERSPAIEYHQRVSVIPHRCNSADPCETLALRHDQADFARPHAGSRCDGAN